MSNSSEIVHEHNYILGHKTNK